MTTSITVTITDNKKAGRVKYFTIEFLTANFEKVIDMVSEIRTEKELRNSIAWTIK
jgi:hypothetical protein